MNQKNNNFRHLVEHACSTLTLSHLTVKEKYKDCPRCLIHYTENGNLLDYVEVGFDNQNASMTFIMDKEDNCVSASIHFHDTKDETLFIMFLRVLSKYYDYRKKRWMLKDAFYVKIDEYEDTGTHFFFRKMIK